MRLERARLIQIVERASTLAARLTGAFVPAGGQDAQSEIDERLATSRDVVANRDQTRFARRIAWDGLDEESVRRALGPVRLREPADLPAWAHLLDEAIAVREDDGHTRRDALAPIPFEEILTP